MYIQELFVGGIDYLGSNKDAMNVCYAVF